MELYLWVLFNYITEYSYYNPLMQTYVQWVLNVQNEPDPNGIDVRIEPKYFLPYGQVYTGSWSSSN